VQPKPEAAQIGSRHGENPELIDRACFRDGGRSTPCT